VPPNLSTFANIKAAAAGVKNRTSARTMPPRSRTPLTQEQIDAIGCWVDDGAQEN
jgi:uncharacterized membrane protein